MLDTQEEMYCAYEEKETETVPRSYMKIEINLWQKWLYNWKVGIPVRNWDCNFYDKCTCK